MKSLRYFKINLFLLLFFAVLSSSCRKNKECTGIITVVQKDVAVGNPLVPVSGATVQLKYGNLDETSTTDADGVATFVLKLPATPDVFVTKGSLKAQSYIKLEPGETTEKTIEIQ